jgi:hypothetical protein
VANNKRKKRMNYKLTFLLILCGLTLYGQEKIYFSQPYTIIENEILIPVNWYVNDIANFQELTELVDSTIFYDEFGDSRERLNYNIGIKYFDFPKNQQLIIYDKFNKKIGIARFIRFEYYENIIESQFVATYSVGNNAIEFEEIGFCINEDANKYIDSKILIKEVQKIDNERTKKIKDKFYVFYEGCLEYQNNDNIEKYHLMSYEDSTKENSENRFVNLVYCIQNNQEKLIVELTEYFIFKELLVTSIMFNKKPIMLCKIGIPGTDFEDFVPLIYENEKYKVGNNIIEY